MPRVSTEYMRTDLLTDADWRAFDPRERAAVRALSDVRVVLLLEERWEAWQRGDLTPEAAAAMQELLDAHRAYLRELDEAQAAEDPAAGPACGCRDRHALRVNGAAGRSASSPLSAPSA